jgi:uncharacterized protein
MPTIIFKASEKCNSNCIYCDVVERKAPRIMSLNLLELVFQKMNEYLEEKPEEEINLTWHGGEPCTLGVNYFKKALEFQERHCSKTKSRLRHSIQSNLTLINQEFLDIFKDIGIDTIGTSYEPIPHIRGGGRKRDSDSYNRLFMKGINLLDKNNFSWGYIYVVTKRALENPLNIFYFLSNLKLSGLFNINPVLVYENNDKHNIAITPLEFAEFLGKIFPVWWEHQDRYPGVQPFKSYLRNYKENARCLGCTESGACAYNYLYIGPSGKVSHCGRSADWDIISYGNIKERPLSVIFKDEQRKILEKRNEVLRDTECADCIYWGICHGGCPLDAYNNQKDFLHKTEWCEAKKVFLEKYFEPITELKRDFSEKDD